MRRRLQRLKRPMLLRRVANEVVRRHGRFIRPERAATNPFDQRVNFFGWQRFVRRHLASAFAADRQDQLAVVRMLRIDDRAVVTPLGEAGFRIEPQVRLLLLSSMTTVTSRCEDRPHLRFKELRSIIRRASIADAQQHRARNQDRCRSAVDHFGSRPFLLNVGQISRHALARIIHELAPCRTGC